MPLPITTIEREWQCGRFRFSLQRPLVMGILNLTADSFSDGGRYLAVDAALQQAARLTAEGADLIDIGGESTRPGAPPLAAEAELARVLPIVEALRGTGVALSVDTYKPQVMRAVLAAGVDMINDIRGFTEPGAIDAVADSGCALCVMHMQGDPTTMQHGPQYQDVVAEVRAFLAARVAALRAGGVASARIVVDPGFGFGKTVEHNYTLLRQLAAVAPDGAPLLVGLSRKSMLGAAIACGGASTNPVPRPPSERLAASVAAALLAVERGAAVLRVHDVAETVDALAVWAALQRCDPDTAPRLRQAAAPSA